MPEGMLSGLSGKALLVEPGDVPSKAQVRAAVPDHCFQRDTLRSMGCVLQSLLSTAACACLAFAIPFKLAATPLWIGYAVLTGTAAMGLWVLAHECGHGAFSDSRRLQDAVGYVLHSALLVPYFSWQVALSHSSPAPLHSSGDHCSLHYPPPIAHHPPSTASHPPRATHRPRLTAH